MILRYIVVYNYYYIILYCIDYIYMSVRALWD
jgi:hypothetical protein